MRWALVFLVASCNGMPPDHPENRPQEEWPPPPPPPPKKTAKPAPPPPPTEPEAVKSVEKPKPPAAPSVGAVVDAGPPPPAPEPPVGPCEGNGTSDESIVRAAFTGFDVKRKRAPVETQGSDHFVKSCKGTLAPAGWHNETDDAFGRVEVARADAGRPVAWLTTQSVQLQWADGTSELRHGGLLVFYRSDGKKVLVEAVAPFVRQPVSDRAIRAERLGSETVYVTHTGRMSQWEAGERVWILRGAELKIAGEYATRLTIKPDGVSEVHTDTTPVFEGALLRLQKKVTLTRPNGQSTTHEEQLFLALENDRLADKGIKR
jgi:hypothetical protein